MIKKENLKSSEKEERIKSTIQRDKIVFITENNKTMNNRLNEKSTHNIVDRTHSPDNLKLNKKSSEELDLEKNENLDDKILNINQSQFYICMMRLFYSRKCVNLYIALIAVSIIIFIYSLISYILKLDEYPVILAEIVLMTIFIFDMAVRIYINRCEKYFSVCINWLDLLLIVSSGVTLFMYLNFNKVAQKIEGISFVLLLFFRNFLQFLRLVILLKKQKQVKKNVEEIIHFTTEMNERKLENLGINKKTKNNAVLSYVDGGNTPDNNPRIKFENFRDNDLN